jgi:SAM-dependent methyltransferase
MTANIAKIIKYLLKYKSDENNLCRIYRNGQLEYYQFARPTENFWKEHWKKEIDNLGIRWNSNNEFIKKTIFKYNSLGDRILEAGCGLCGFLYTMHYQGYKAIGIDFAKDTLLYVKKLKPELNLCISNVRRLPFKDKSFDAYWSIGVIEHYKNGYKEIISECHRVLKSGAIAYISFPYMNLLRKIKAKFGMYDRKVPLKNLQFYQYALNHKRVRKTVEDYGFTYLGKVYMFPYIRFNFIKNKLIKLLIDPWHHHSIMLIFKKI